MVDKKYDDMTEEERTAFDKQAREKEQAEQAALPYRWSQDLANVTVNVDLPKGTRGKDLVVVIDKRKLKVDTLWNCICMSTCLWQVQIKGSEPILEGELFNDISKDDSSWTIGTAFPVAASCCESDFVVDEGVLTIELEKVSAHIQSHQWWPHVLTHHPKIDTTKIQPENSKLSDLDGETRAMVEKMMVSA